MLFVWENGVVDVTMIANTSKNVNTRVTGQLTRSNFSITLVCGEGTRRTRGATSRVAFSNNDTGACGYSMHSDSRVASTVRTVRHSFNRVDMLMGGTKVSRRGLLASVASSS